MIIKLMNKNENAFVAELTEDLILGLTGGLAYFYMEIAFRDYSHYSMIICGGICFLIVGKMGKTILEKETNIIKAVFMIMFFGSLVITTLELFTGIIVNKILKLDVWDYSSEKYNVYGQICLTYTALWALFSLLCVYAANMIRINILKN